MITSPFRQTRRARAFQTICTVLAIWSMSHSAEATSPSFDCHKAQAPDEIAICQEAVLADIDVLISRAFRRYAAEFRPKDDVGAAYLADRRACDSDVACIAAIQARALETYGGKSPWVDLFAQGMMGRKASTYANSAYSSTAINKPGECAKTRVRKVTTRFGEPVNDENEDQGTAIEYENGDHQVSYSRDDLYGIEPRQTVVLCLMSVLHDCPKGDARGNLYLALDLDTGTQWTLTDTQHMCGGA
jgi:uncharacterized protein